MSYKSSKLNLAGALFAMMFIIILLVPQPANAEHVNGEYTIEFNILHADKRNASIAEGYWNQPATVYIEDGDIRVQTTINKHAWVTAFAVSYKGTMSEVKTISIDEEANTRVTEFPVANLTDLVESNVSVTIDEIGYEHSYTMYFKFKPETLTLVKADESAVSDVPEQPTTPASAEDPKPEEPAEDQGESPALTPVESADASEQSGSEPASQTKQSDPNSEAADDEEAADESAAQPGSDAEVGADSRDAAGDEDEEEMPAETEDIVQVEQDASEDNEAAHDEAAGFEDAAEKSEKSNIGSTITIIVVLIVFVGIIAMTAYRTRQNKK